MGGITAPSWRTSSKSSPQGNCVQAMATWRTSTHSGNGGNCVQVAQIKPGVSWS